jgi:hypothetical protein
MILTYLANLQFAPSTLPPACWKCFPSWSGSPIFMVKMCSHVYILIVGTYAERASFHTDKLQTILSDVRCIICLSNLTKRLHLSGSLVMLYSFV